MYCGLAHLYISWALCCFNCWSNIVLDLCQNITCDTQIGTTGGHVKYLCKSHSVRKGEDSPNADTGRTCIDFLREMVGDRIISVNLWPACSLTSVHIICIYLQGDRGRENCVRPIQNEVLKVCLPVRYHFICIKIRNRVGHDSIQFNSIYLHSVNPDTGRHPRIWNKSNTI
jgi:hypothetical protein